MISFTLIQYFIFNVYTLSSFFLHLVKRFIALQDIQILVMEFFRDLDSIIGTIQLQAKNKPDAALFDIALFCFCMPP